MGSQDLARASCKVQVCAEGIYHIYTHTHTPHTRFLKTAALLCFRIAHHACRRVSEGTNLMISNCRNEIREAAASSFAQHLRRNTASCSGKDLSRDVC